MNVIAILIRGERYVVLYDDDPRSLVAVCVAMAEWLCDEELETFGCGEYLAVMDRVAGNVGDGT